MNIILFLNKNFCLGHIKKGIINNIPKKILKQFFQLEYLLYNAFVDMSQETNLKLNFWFEEILVFF